MNKFLLACLFVFLTSCAGVTHAGRLIDVTIVDRDTGEVFPVYRHAGKLYVAGQPGHKYAIQVRNRTSDRLLTVISVDGVNAITGQSAAPEQAGYAFEAYAMSRIQGWRKNLDEVAAFIFTSLPDSYAARTGRPDNVGVIGVAVFREQQDARVFLGRPKAAETEKYTPDSSAPASRMRSEEALRDDERLGTGHGEREPSRVAYTDFRRESSRPNELIRIYYDSWANLIARGVIPPYPTSHPDPFPSRFTPDPWG